MSSDDGFNIPPGELPSEPHEPEVMAHHALRRIVRNLPPVERAYAQVRFKIMRPKLLAMMDLLLPVEGRMLDVGCGFGLFASYFGQMHRGREIVGVDPDARRVQIASDVASRLSLANRYMVGDVRDVELAGSFAAAYVLDVMHHIPRDEQVPVLVRLRELLKPGGLLLLKDITTVPAFGLRFTELLDRVMVGWNAPLAYRHHSEWAQILSGLGFAVRAERVPDILPYPHVIIGAYRRD